MIALAVAAPVVQQLSEASHAIVFSPATVSALAAATAALVAAAVGGVQLYIGRKQAAVALLAAQAATVNAQAAMKTAESSGRRRIAEFRQAWIDKVIDTLTEYQSLVILSAQARKNPGVDSLSWDDNIRYHALRAKLEILLNPEEPATTELLSALDDVGGQVGGVIAKMGKTPKVVAIARKLLKAEWVRIKTELT